MKRGKQVFFVLVLVMGMTWCVTSASAAFAWRGIFLTENPLPPEPSSTPEQTPESSPEASPAASPAETPVFPPTQTVAASATLPPNKTPAPTATKAEATPTETPDAGSGTETPSGGETPFYPSVSLSPSVSPPASVLPALPTLPPQEGNGGVDLWSFTFWIIVVLIVGIWGGIGIGYGIWGRRRKSTMFRYRH